MIRLPLWVCLGVLVTAALACGRGDGSAGPARGPRAAPLVAVATAHRRELEVFLSAPVDLRAAERVDVGSKTLGYLGAMLVDRGDHVRRGQVVALVRPSDLPDRLTMAREALVQAQAAAAFARDNVQRTRALADEAAAPVQELVENEAKMRAAQAGEEAARANLASLGVQLGETRILSPLTGVVALRRLDPGALVGPTLGPMLTVVRVDFLRAFVAVTEHHLDELTVGTDVLLTVDAFPERELHGRITRVPPTLDPLTRTAEVEVHVANADGRLRPGMFAKARLLLERRADALMVPAQALRVADGRSSVYVVKDGTVRRRAVQLGHVDETTAEVRGGLAAGEEIVVAGIELCTDGGKVRVRREAPAPSGAVAIRVGG